MGRPRRTGRGATRRTFDSTASGTATKFRARRRREPDAAVPESWHEDPSSCRSSMARDCRAGTPHRSRTEGAATPLPSRPATCWTQSRRIRHCRPFAIRHPPRRRRIPAIAGVALGGVPASAVRTTISAIAGMADLSGVMPFPRKSAGVFPTLGDHREPCLQTGSRFRPRYAAGSASHCRSRHCGSTRRREVKSAYGCQPARSATRTSSTWTVDGEANCRRCSGTRSPG